ncbi:hypothetical protein BaOVIS_017910 [Babesia ovis]|uniref:tRNA (guanine(9)-N(1))-methyltransferase n=1 Tax=Babesia ovis TaxID=5869 RepID=A0A9W5WVJ9_BABOV|nr:hypothetical protein BaOVIS_017910 [Babesia ovis]
MGDRHHRYNNDTRNYDLDALTQGMLHEVADVFAINCIKPWQAEGVDPETLGRIKAEDFIHVARQLGCVFTAPETRAIERQFKKHNIHYINIDQFVQLINNKIKQDRVDIEHEPFVTPNQIMTSKLGELYDILDWQKQNKLTTADLKHFLASLNEGEFGQKAIETLFKNENIKLKRNITKEEFMNTVEETIVEGSNNVEPVLEAEQEKTKRLPRSQKKRLAKQRYKEKRKERRRERRKTHRERRSLELREIVAGMTEEERQQYIIDRRKQKEEEKALQEQFIQDAHDNGMPICINLNFANIMNDKESKSLARQVSYMYNCVKKRMTKVKLVLTGLNTESILYSHLQLFNVDKWKVHKHTEDYWEVIDRNNIIVLSPDADEEIEEIDQSKTYVIGGLVDVNVKKKLTLEQAIEHGLTTRALPIKKYFPECKKRILNLTAVFGILVMRANNHTHMFKRAYLYSCTAPAPEADESEQTDVIPIVESERAESEKKSKKRKAGEQSQKDNHDEQSQKQTEFITLAPRGNVAKCKLCKGKTMLNQDAVNKHLGSKAHKKNYKKYEKEQEEADNTRLRFLQRMESLEKRVKTVNTVPDNDD